MYHKTHGTTIDDAEDVDFVTSMYNLLEYSSNYSETKGSLWIYSKYEAANFNVDIANTDVFKFFKCRNKLFGNTEADGAN